MDRLTTSHHAAGCCDNLHMQDVRLPGFRVHGQSRVRARLPSVTSVLTAEGETVITGIRQFGRSFVYSTANLQKLGSKVQ